MFGEEGVVTMAMRISRLRIEEKDVERLLASVRALPHERIGDCIEAEQAASYATGALSAEGSDLVERHFESCHECAERLERVFAGLKEFDREQKLLYWLKAQLEALRAPVRALSRGLALPLALPDEFRLAFVGQHYDTPATLEGATPDGLLRWRFVEDRDEVVVSLETTVPELLLNPNIRLRWGRAIETVTFEERAGHIVGWAVFSKRQLADLTHEDVPSLEFLDSGRETPM
jgi:hypothetical protein